MGNLDDQTVERQPNNVDGLGSERFFAPLPNVAVLRVNQSID
ncbi:MAG: hypothetical protein AAF961_03165 [Planctomycetota bacterium]